MATFQKFDAFVADAANKVHNLGADVLKIMLTDIAPVRGNTVKANLTEITAEHGYAAGGAVVGIASSAQVAGLYKLIASGVVTFTASGGSIGPFRYVVLYNSSPGAGPLIGWYDYGSEVTLNDTDTFKDTFDAVNGIINLQ